MKFNLIKKIKRIKKKRVPTIRVGTHKKGVIILWIVLIISLFFGVYKNFTAINKHTVYQKEIVQKQVLDTNNVERFVEQFAYHYYSWGQSQREIDARNNNLKNYLTEELQQLNMDMIRSDIPTRSRLINLKIWNVEQLKDNNFKVLYSVNQQITERKLVKNIDSTYHLTIHVDNKGNMVIIQNPTMDTKPTKSAYTPTTIENDGSVDASISDEITDFLTTFFKAYPKLSEKELSYYVKDGVLKPVNKNYIFSELNKTSFYTKDNMIGASITVKYLDNETKTILYFQYDLILQKSDNWKIIS